MIAYRPDRPLIVQADRSLLLEVDSPHFAECRDRLAAFAELRKSPEHVHTYAITPLSLWNACAAGVTVEGVVETLATFSRYELPPNVLADIRDLMGRYGRLRLLSRGGGLVLETDEPGLVGQLRRNPRLGALLGGPESGETASVALLQRGPLKQALLKAGLPVEDLAGYVEGAPLPIGLRDYQRAAVDTFWAGGGPRGGSGVLVLPCGAGKTVIGLGIMARARCHTLILCTSITALRQWQRELLSKTDVNEGAIGPKRCDAPWKELEAQGWIAPAVCTEVRVPVPRELRLAYAAAEQREQYRLAATNPTKLSALQGLLERHRGDRVLVIGQYLDQLERVAKLLDAPLITGKTPTRQREALFDAFRRGEIRLLVVSKVANFAIDLPEANVAIELSGAFGSRQEEAQRLGRILRPKASGGQASFYAVVSHDTVDQRYSDHRQLFLTEQGYRYQIEDFTPAAGVVTA